jgi:hypothetical protein
MSHQEIGLVGIGLILIQGLIAIVLSHGINGHYFKNSKNQAEAFRKLRADKPLTAKIIGLCYLLCVFELLFGLLHNFGGR